MKFEYNSIIMTNESILLPVLKVPNYIYFYATGL
jgi:hypothetical protein